MGKQTNDCGVRNHFGYYDASAKEIVLKHPCLKKADINDVYSWLDEAHDLKKFSIGVGCVEDLVVDDTQSALYSSARAAILRDISQTQAVDNEILKNMLPRLKNKPNLRNIGLKCYVFSEDKVLFDLLLRTVSEAKNLVYLDLTGSYFSDEQLIDLSLVVSRSHISHMLWPEPRMSEMTLKKVKENLDLNKSLVVLRGVPTELQEIAFKNRQWLFSLAKRPTLITDKEKDILIEYADSARLALAFEKQRLFDLEKAIEAVIS